MRIADIPHKHVVIGKSVKRISLQRFIVTKIVYFPDEVTERDLFALYSNQLYLQGKAQKEKDFQHNFGLSLELLAKELKSSNLTQGVSVKVLRGMGQRILKNLPDFLVPKRNFQDWNLRMSGTYHLIFSQSQDVETKSLPLKSYIGVGYKDKGSTRDKAVDGSPPWQEIASRVARLEREISEIKSEENWNGLSGMEKIQHARLILSKRKELDNIKRVH